MIFLFCMIKWSVKLNRTGGEKEDNTIKALFLDDLYAEGVKIQQQLGLKEKRSWLTAQEYMQKLNKHRKNKYL